MKKLLVVFALLLSGCAATSSVTSSLTSKVKSYIPRKHDPALAMYYVETKIATDYLDCKTYDVKWDIALTNSHRLTEYASFRRDPQADTVKAVETNLRKAKETTATCDSYLKITKLRLQVIDKAWSGR